MKTAILFSILFAFALSCPNEAHCSRCLSEEAGPGCFFCPGGFLSQKSECNPVPQEKAIPHCQHYYKLSPEDDTFRCSRCEIGFGLTSDFESKRCLPCLASDCQVCTYYDKCEACKDLRILGTLQTGETTCTNRVESIPNCSWFYPPEKGEKAICAECLPGFSLLSVQSEKDKLWTSKCIKSRFANCLSLTDEEPIQCEECEPGYTITTEGSCVKTSELPQWLAENAKKVPKKPAEVPKELGKGTQETVAADKGTRDPEEKESTTNPAVVPAHLKWVLVFGAILLIAGSVALWMSRPKGAQADPALSQEMQVTQG